MNALVMLIALGSSLADAPPPASADAAASVTETSPGAMTSAGATSEEASASRLRSTQS